MAGISQVVIDNIALDIDPEDYVMLGGQRRGSVHRVIGGTTVYQDMGINPSDLIIQMSGKFIDVTTLKSIYAIYRKTGHQITLTDFKGNNFTVIFVPGVESFQVKPIYGSAQGYLYVMTFSVVSVNTWFSTSGGFPPNI